MVLPVEIKKIVTRILWTKPGFEHVQVNILLRNLEQVA